ncbi:MAG: hypothetical protein IKG09_00765 [Mycoplasmataceae bacterium]|nr:hypothetical protein [Mycoplasmataceae bacterium]
MLQAQIEDTIIVDHVLLTLMGTHVESRREFIEKNTKYVKCINLIIKVNFIYFHSQIFFVYVILLKWQMA